jgi:hypothetical protein
MNTKNLSIPLTLVVSIFVPSAAGLAAYYKGMSDQKVEIAQLRVEREQLFVRKQDMEKLEVKLDRMSNDLSDIKSMIRRR